MANKDRLRYKYLWTRDGNIYVKAKDDTDKIQIITKNLFNSTSESVSR